jgi:WhiB family transcriptional regulator, redox-sensing transcriptional regulator
MHGMPAPQEETMSQATEYKTDVSWMEQAACLNEDPQIFWIDPEMDSPELREMKILAARNICAECPVLAECTLWGILDAQNDHWSILGGLTHRQRRSIRREIGWDK